MDLQTFAKQFTSVKRAMPLNDAADYIRRLRKTEFPMLPKTGHINIPEYDRRLAQRAACDMLEAAFRKAAPWEDYREIIAGFEYPIMQRVCRHIAKGYYSGAYGKKWGEADAWFVDMWMAYHTVFCAMPGSIPDTGVWGMFNHLMLDAERKTRRFRRIF